MRRKKILEKVVFQATQPKEEKTQQFPAKYGENLEKDEWKLMGGEVENSKVICGNVKG